MHAERNLNDTAKFELPQDLVAEMNRRSTTRNDAFTRSSSSSLRSSAASRAS